MRKINLIIKILLTAILIMLFFSSCAKNKGEKTIKVGVSIANFDDKFMGYVKNGLEEYQKSLRDKVEVVYLDAKFDVEKQKQQVKFFIEKQMDAIIVIPVSTRETSEMTDVALNAKIPLVYLNIFPDQFYNKELPDGVYYVGSKEIEAGVIQMNYLVEKLGGKGDVVILMGELNTSASQLRTLGAETVADKYPEINIIDKRTAKWLRPLASSVVEDWLNSGKNFDAVVANNDEMAIGAIETLEKYNKLDSIVVVGVDATKEAIEELKLGRLSATVFQDSKKQGEEALGIAINVTKGKVVKKETWIPFKLVTLNNYKEFLNN